MLQVIISHFTQPPLVPPSFYSVYIPLVKIETLCFVIHINLNNWWQPERKEVLVTQLLTDVHAPAKERLSGPVVNIPEFYEAFGVRPGDKMYRPDSLRVSIW
ncbi:MAG TPA: M13-type metalloendopeptidase [Puia sp.]